MLSLCGVSGSWCAEGFVWALQASLAGMGFDSRQDFAPPTILLGLLLCPWMWGIFFGGSNILLLMVVQQRVVILNFLQKEMSTRLSSLPSCHCRKQHMSGRRSACSLICLWSSSSCCRCLVANLCLSLCHPMGCSPPGCLSWDSPGKNTEVGCYLVLQGNLPNPGIEPVSPALASGVFTVELPGRYLYLYTFIYSTLLYKSTVISLQISFLES